MFGCDCRGCPVTGLTAGSVRINLRDVESLIEATKVQQEKRAHFGYLHEEDQWPTLLKEERRQLHVELKKEVENSSSFFPMPPPSFVRPEEQEEVEEALQPCAQEADISRSPKEEQEYHEQVVVQEMEPQTLLIISPNHVTICAGLYTLDVTARPNGQPLWRQEGGKCCVYQGPNGHWYIGGTAAEKKQFICAAGFLRHSKSCPNVMPHQLDAGCWQWGDASLWHIDADISVMAMLAEERKQWERKEAQRKETELRATNQEPTVSTNVCPQEHGFPQGCKSRFLRFSCARRCFRRHSAAQPSHP